MLTLRKSFNHDNLLSNVCVRLGRARLPDHRHRYFNSPSKKHVIISKPYKYMLFFQLEG